MSNDKTKPGTRQISITEAPPRPKRKRPPNRKGYKKETAAAKRSRQTLEAMDLYSKGVSQQDIATIQGVDKTTVIKRMEQYSHLLDHVKNLHLFRSAREELLEAGVMQVLQYLTDPKKLEKASVSATAAAFKELNSALRLERGQSTANISNQTRFVTVDTSAFRNKRENSDS